jgi:YegS/Rv2252/BmrU family lipid kinase
MNITVIINPVAGGIGPDRARARAELASGVLASHGADGAVFVTERRGHARELAAAAVLRGAGRVVAWGGDGTLNEVASALSFQREVAMAIVPAGSGNGLARELKVDFSPERAIAEAIRATPAAIDVGEINGRLFVNLAGVGFDAHVAAQFDRRANRRRGFRGYASVVARALVTYDPGRYVITTGAARMTPRAILVTIANSAQFGNDARIAPGAVVNDGLLDLVVVEESARWRTIVNVPRLFNGSIGRMPGCSIDRIREARIEADRPMTFHVDGEPVEGGTRLDVRVRPAALQIAVR